MSDERTEVVEPTGPIPVEPVAVFDREDLSPTGDGDGVISQGMGMALMNLVAELKERRAAMGLTIAEVARRSGLTVVTLSRLENLHNRNPSLDAIFRYAMALDRLVTLSLEEIEPESESDR